MQCKNRPENYLYEHYLPSQVRCNIFDLYTTFCFWNSFKRELEIHSPLSYQQCLFKSTNFLCGNPTIARNCSDLIYQIFSCEIYQFRILDKLAFLTKTFFLENDLCCLVAIAHTQYY